MPEMVKQNFYQIITLGYSGKPFLKIIWKSVRKPYG